MLIVLRETGINWIYVGSYLGPLAALCALIGLLNWRAALPWLLAGEAFFWLALGAGASPSLWNLLRRL